MKKLLSILLAVLMVISIVPLSASAGTDTGKCGTNLAWSFDTITGVLDITGSGAMSDWTSPTNVPWEDYTQYIKTVNLPEEITSIGGYAFFYCGNLSNVTIPDGVISIGESAFQACSSLESVVIPEGATVKPYAFMGSGLTSLIISENCSIGVSVFKGCSALTTVVLPASTKSISNAVFENCKNIKNVYFAGTAEEWKSVYIGSYNNYLTSAKRHYCDVITAEATCLEDGVIKYACTECSDSIVVKVTSEALGHTYTSEVTKEPTHLKEGVETFTCACGDSYTEAIAKLEGHTYTSEVTKEATHLEEGVTTYTCACGDSYTEAIAKLEGHTYTSEVTKEATHLEEGETTYTCACGDSYTEAIEKLEGHTYKAVVTEPTCTAKGYTTYTCECGDSYVSDYVGTKEHSYSSTVTTPATHTKEGVLTYTCSVCGDSYTDSIAKTPEHKYTDSYVVAPTCENEGYTAHVCECGDIKKDNFTEKTGHSYNGRVCENCGEKCSHMCHYSGFLQFIWKIVNFFYKLFRVNKTCACGIAHY